MDNKSINQVIEVLSDRLDHNQKKQFDKEDVFANTPLMLAIKKQQLSLATKFIENGFYDQSRVDTCSHLTPLHAASPISDESFLNMLTKSFINHINTQDYQGNTPVHYAAWNRNKKYVEILLQNGANVTIQNTFGYTPLHIACAANNPKHDHSSKLEELLLANGAEVDALNNDQETPLMVLFKLDKQDEIIPAGSKYDPITTLMALLNAKADFNRESISQKTPLHYACIRGATISALTLINNGADCNKRDYSDTTPYGYALKNNHEDL